MRYTVDIDRTIDSFADCIKRVNEGINAWDWRISINAGGIDFGIYFNFDIKNKELEIQLQQLEQFSSQCKTKTIDNSIYNSFRTGVQKNGKMKPKISNTARLRKTKSVITSNPFNTVLKPSSSFSQKENKIDAIQSKMDAIRKLVINSTEKSHIVKTIKNTESFIVDYVKYLNKTHCIQEEKSNKQIERLTRENKILKEKLSQIFSLLER